MLDSMRRAAASCALLLALAAAAAAQNDAQPKPADAGTAPAPPPVAGNLLGLDEMRRQLREQREEIDSLRSALKEQARLLEELRTRVEQTAPARPAAVIADASYKPGAAPPTTSGQQTPAGGQTGAGGQAARNQEAPPRQPSAPGITFSGDIRLRYESLYGQQNAVATSGAPAELGNPLTSRQRFRIRARLAARGRLTEEFEWGLRLATGGFSDVHSTNQNLTDFYSRKPFALDQAFVTWRPKALPGFRAQGGKFETPWWRTEMTWDNDNSPEGFNEQYTFTPKKSAVKDVTFLAWQLPMLERNAAFVLGADGLVDLSASGRAGRDLAMYGGQLRAVIEPSKDFALRLAVSDHYYSGTQFITPAQFFGPNVQFPVTVNIPASGTTPARTVTTQVSVPREFLVTGNGNLGFSTANNNAVNRDGRLSSGFNLVGLFAQLDFNRQSRRWPFLFIFDFVKNTQAHDVVTAGPAGADLLLPNREDTGFWAEIQAGKDVLRLPVDRISRGDLMFNYTFTRIEKDAVLTPFNFSDLSVFSDVRAHRFMVAYALEPRVAVAFNGYFTQRPNGLLGPFAATPPGSLNRTLTRLQLDTIFRF